MSDVPYATAVVLAGIFAWAGAAKLADRRGTTATFAAFGLPAAGLLGTAVPVTELLLAVGLLTVPALAAYAALALLAAFTTFVVRAVRAGVDVGCGCFGTASAEPVSTVEVLRNVLLTGAAVVASFAAGPLVPDLPSVILVAAVTALAAVALALGRRRRTGSALAAGHLPPGPGPGGT